MLKKLRRNIIITNMILVSVLLISLEVFMLINSSRDITESTHESLKQSVNIVLTEDKHTHYQENELKENKNHFFGWRTVFSSSFNEKMSKNDIRYLTRSTITIVYDKKDESITEKLSTASMDDTVLKESVSQALERTDDFGFLHNLGLYYYKYSTNDSVVISFADLTQTYSYTFKLAVIYSIYIVIGLAFLFVISLLISNFAIRPIKKTWKQEQQFVADVSHELKTPITVIRANNSIIQSHQDDIVKNQMKWIKSTESEVEHMQKLISNMLNLERLESTNKKDLFSRQDLGSIVNRCILQFEAVAFEKSITFSNDIKSGIFVQGDETQLLQMFNILIDNAVKYSPNNSEISVNLHSKYKKAIFSIHTDTYIDSEDLAHIFDRFYRADKSRNKDSDNSYGLGLPIAKSIVTNHKGKISVTSSEENGTVFTIEINK